MNGSEKKLEITGFFKYNPTVQLYGVILIIDSAILEQSGASSYVRMK